LNGWCTLSCQTSMRFAREIYNSVAITNKMQLGNGIYYSTVHYKLNTFRAVCRSSSGAPTVFAASGLHTHVETARTGGLHMRM